MIKYEIGKYKGKWAVFCTPSCVWYFPTQKGKEGAQKLAEKLTKGE